MSDLKELERRLEQSYAAYQNGTLDRVQRARSWPAKDANGKPFGRPEGWPEKDANGMPFGSQYSRPYR